MLNAPQDLHAELVPTALPTALSSVRSCRQKCSLHSTKQARRDHGPLLASSIPVACMGPSRCHPGHWWTRWTSPPTATQEALPHMQTRQPTAQCRSANELPGQKSKDWENREKVCVEKKYKNSKTVILDQLCMYITLLESSCGRKQWKETSAYQAVVPSFPHRFSKEQSMHYQSLKVLTITAPNPVISTDVGKLLTPLSQLFMMQKPWVFSAA